jgi:O-antigen/teichoic acid export membrane protein
VAVGEVAARAKPARARARVSGVVALLTAANVLNAAGGFVTGPLLARALGASGRGDLQAVLLPLGLVPGILGLGIPAFAYRTLPRGRTVEEVIGSLGPPLLVIGLIAAAAAVPVADFLAAGRATVRTWLIVGLLATPLVLLGSLALSSLAALERWRAVVAMTAIPFAVPFVATVVLFVSGHLTVPTAAAAAIAGSLLALVPALPMLIKVRRPVFRLSLARGGIDFGLKSWVGGLALTANGRLDQLLMITFVSSRQLGLYAVATTISGVFGLVTGAVSPPLMARIASGERFLMPQAVRIAVMLTLGMNVIVALMTPIVLSVLFGPEFHAAANMAFVLLAASVPLAGASVLSSALQADGAPLIPTAAEGVALVITVTGLLTLLGPLQAMGAAFVSLAAYSTSFVFQLVMARRRIGAPVSAFLVPSRADVRWARELLTGMVLRLKPSV